MSTIRKVAELAQVSTATVSRALRGSPSVTSETRRRVEDAARQLDYVLPFIPSSLASGRTNTVGVVTPYLARWYFGTAISAIEEVVHRSNLDTVLYTLGSQDIRQRFFENMPLRRRVDAVIVVSIPLAEAEVQALRRLDVPLGLVGLDIDGFSSVRIDDHQGGWIAAKHLLERGHRRIGLVSGLRGEPFHFDAPTSRRAGFLDALRDSGLELLDGMEADGAFTVEGGQTAMETLLRLPEPPTAVFAMSDEMAFGALRALRLRGLSTPRDMALMGFDDHELAAAVDLTTVAQPTASQGQAAAEAVIAQLDGAPPRRQVFGTTLVVRASTCGD
ncbi:LacI family DNA-binding transcriptional regulator [Lentzea flaviverrucosa]|uniref:DNA-binding transcriptional regulator, LacI/PurR family n=1 Tax=Lentzea flaviverrucosa TaxID=200379 RepID=A0A1H9XSD2_9PSEU|nr:LacI family DNA-binding transcriptional regulator [Lentzea flaviverrucosa]RDI19351.1 LacI family transcriptional regulator [Lentzea flaviverrucosa]SES48959.1 DNA-binding transcriptional regulator, LacI/PurR family [Lentzea flaviverrucosa]